MSSARERLAAAQRELVKAFIADEVGGTGVDPERFAAQSKVLAWKRERYLPSTPKPPSRLKKMFSR